MSRFSRGLNRDSHPVDQPEGTYTDLINGIFDHSGNFITNENGNKSRATFNNTPIGKITLVGNKTVIFSIDPDGNSEIGVFNSEDNIYEVLINDFNIAEDKKLKFSRKNPVEGDFRITNTLDTVIYFTDNNNPPRFLNIDDPGTLDFGKGASLFPVLNSVPDVILAAVNLAGGSLLSGGYQFAIAYLDGTDTPTNYFHVTNVVQINDEGTLSPPEDFDGCPNDTITTKSIQLDFSGLDASFAKLRVAIIKDGKVDRIDDVAFSGTTHSLTYVGNESLTPSALEEIIIGNANYDRVRTIKQMDGYLFMGNLGGAGVIDIGYQRYANNIELELVTEVIPDFLTGTNTASIEDTNLYKDPIFSFDGKTYRRGEAYAIYISFILESGNETMAYHIPGRNIAPSDETPIGHSINGPEADALSGLSGTPNWKFHYNPDFTSGMAYWHNDNEFYPDTDDFDVWDVSGGVGIPHASKATLRGKNVRHHRFPGFEYSFFYDGFDNTNSARRIGFKLNNVKIPDSIGSQILGYKVYFAKRTSNNRIVLDQALGIHAGLDLEGNYQCLGRGDAHDNTPTDRQDNILFLYPFTGLRKKGLDTRPNFVQEVYICDPGTPGSDFTVNMKGSLTTAIPQQLRRIDGSTFTFVNGHTDLIILTNVGYGANLSASKSVEGFVCKLITPMTNIGTRVYRNIVWNICTYRSNLFNPFTSQELVHTGYVHTSIGDLENLDSSDIFGGDTFINFYAFKSHAEDAVASNPIFLHQFVCESDDNIGYRHQGVEPFEEYYPRTDFSTIIDDAEEIADVTRVDVNNYMGYNELGYSKNNEIKPAFPFDEVGEATFRYPTRIIRSKKDDGNNTGDPFRDFSDQDFKDLPKNRGEIVKLSQFNNSLIVHFERGLMRTKGREELLVGDTRAFLGTGDILAVDPDELISTDAGYGGIQDSFTALSTKYGYFFVDTQAKKVFLLSDSLKEISHLGMRSFFENNLGKELLKYGYREDEVPYPYYSIYATYDPIHDRIILTKRDYGITDLTLSLFKDNKIRWSTGRGVFQVFTKLGPGPPPLFGWLDLDINDPLYFKDISWTLSFLPARNMWVGFHSYKPSFYFSNIKTFYSIESGFIYEHNTGDVSNFYGTVRDFEIEFVGNNPIGISKQLMSLAFNTRVENIIDKTEIINSTIDRIRVTNGYQDTGELNVIAFPATKFNTRKVKRIWHFNKLRDTLSIPDIPKLPTHVYKKFLQDQYHIVRFKYSNSNKYRLYLFDAFLNTKPSHR